MTPDPAPDETERAGDLCAACGHERGEHLPPCEMGISTGRPCGCRQFKVPDETERVACNQEWLDIDDELHHCVKKPWDHHDGHHQDRAGNQWAQRWRLVTEVSRDERKIGDEGCTCTLPPSYEGPCAWCDIHGQPSVAWSQGVAEGENAGRVFERELRDLRTKFAALRAELAETRTAMEAFHNSATAMRRDRDRLSAALRSMARRSNENRRSYIESARRTLVARAELKAHRELAEQGWGRPSVRVMEENAQLRTELAEVRALHQETWTRSRDRGFELDRLKRDSGRLNRELAELKAGRAAHVCDLGPALDAIRPGPGLRVEFADEAVPATFCAHHGDDNYFDRTLCAPPCDTMHTRCRECGKPLEPCAHSTPADRGPLTPHPPPWPVSVDGVLTSPSVVENFDKEGSSGGDSV